MLAPAAAPFEYDESMEMYLDTVREAHGVAGVAALRAYFTQHPNAEAEAYIDARLTAATATTARVTAAVDNMRTFFATLPLIAPAVTHIPASLVLAPSGFWQKVTQILEDVHTADVMEAHATAIAAACGRHVPATPMHPLYVSACKLSTAVAASHDLWPRGQGDLAVEVIKEALAEYDADARRMETTTGSEPVRWHT